MTFDASKPASNQSPSLAPNQIQTNWLRLQTLISGDHLFNASADTNDGYHKIIHWVTQGSAPPAINGTGLTYALNDTVKVNAVDQTAAHLFHRSYDGTTEITSPLSQVPIRAFANWNGVSGATIRSSYNVDSISRTSSGEYTINFTAGALPTNTYAISLCGMRNSDNTTAGYVLGNATYGTVVTTTSIKVEFRSISGGNLEDVLMGNIVVYGG